MACKNAYKAQMNESELVDSPSKTEEVNEVNRLLFGVHSTDKANELLQNNLELFDWVKRNKIDPNFWGRNLVGENPLTREEIDHLHNKGIKIAPIFNSEDPKKTEEQGRLLAKKIDVVATELRIPSGTAIFLEIGEEKATTDFMKGYAEGLMMEGFTPGFKANTDSKYSFDREFSRGLQTAKETFKKCLVWAVTPILSEYEKMTTTHLIHPDNWTPFAPSGISRKKVAIWQYGKDCHPIENEKGENTAIQLDLVRNESVIIEKMF